MSKARERRPREGWVESLIGLLLVAVALLVVILVCALVLLAALPLARAHGDAEWIQRGGYKNAVGELCCGERDCGYKAGGTVREVSGGYDVNAWFFVHPPGGEPFFIHLKEVVPFSDATPSPTGEFWLCKWNGQRKCFFAPPGST